MPKTHTVLLVAGFVVCTVWFFLFTSWTVGEVATQQTAAETKQLTREELLPTKKIVFIEVSIDDVPAGRIDIGLFIDHAPITSENFRSLISGDRGRAQSFVGTVFHRIITNFVVQGGSVYDKKKMTKDEYDAFIFDDEPSALELKHSARYLVQMANRGPNTNNAQWCIMLKPSPHLNGKHAVFGRVVKGFDVVDRIEELASSQSGTPRAVVKVTAAGEY